MNIREDIGRRIYALRHKHGMTQQDLVYAMHPDTDKHFAAETISVWEHGRRTPTARSIKRLAAVFGVSMDYIINGITEESDGRTD